MTIRSIGEFHPVPERPGMRTRALIATEHGFTSCFVAEFEMDQGASIPLHTHPIEEGFVVTEGAVTIQLGEETITATAGCVVRIPPGCPTRFVIRRSIRRVFSAQRRGIERTSSKRPASISKAFHGKSENLRSGPARGPMSNTSTLRLTAQLAVQRTGRSRCSPPAADRSVEQQPNQ